MKRFPHFFQLDAMDCGPACLRMVAKYYGKSFNLDTLRQRSEYTRSGVSMLGISNAAESIGLKTLGAKLSFEELCAAPLPCIVHWNKRHFVVVYDIRKRRGLYKIYIADPASKNLVYTEEQFKKCWISTVSEGEEKGVALLLEPTPDFYSQTGEKINRKNFGFLLNYIKPYKKLLLQLALALLTASLIQLILPFLTQNIVDVGIGTRNISFI